jgi:alanine racemase
VTSVPSNRIEISISALLTNIRLIRERIGEALALVGVVKANAYGHGLEQIITAIAEEVDSFQVDDLNELEKIRKITDKEVLLLGYLAEEEVAEAIKLKAVISVSCEQTVNTVNNIAEDAGILQPVIIAFDSGFGREGVQLSELKKLFTLINKSKNLELTGLYSHLSCADDSAQSANTIEQRRLFQEAVTLLKNTNLKLHIANTAGILNPDAWTISTAARLGLGLYGCWPSEDLKHVPENKGLALTPALRWVSWLSQIKEVPALSPIGYGRTFITEGPIKIAVVPQGYSDGYNRLLSNQGEVLVKGKRCRVIGRVSMNMMTVDVSHIQDCQIGDEVILLGRSGKEIITAEELAKRCSTISYEIFTSLSPFLARVLVD